jgi:hypothetical protein
MGTHARIIKNNQQQQRPDDELTDCDWHGRGRDRNGTTGDPLFSLHRQPLTDLSLEHTVPKRKHWSTYVCDVIIYLEED